MRGELTGYYDSVCFVYLSIRGVHSWGSAVGRDAHGFSATLPEDELDAGLFGKVSRPCAALVCHDETRG